MVNKKDADAGKLTIILLWIFWPVGLILWLADEKMKKNTFVKFHVKQWLVALIITMALYFIGSIIPILGWFLILPIAMILGLIWFIQGIVFAIQGKESELWIIGKYGNQWFKF